MTICNCGAKTDQNIKNINFFENSCFMALNCAADTSLQLIYQFNVYFLFFILSLVYATPKCLNFTSNFSKVLPSGVESCLNFLVQ